MTERDGSSEGTVGIGELLAQNRAALAITVVVIGLAATFVILSLRQPEVPTFPPSAVSPVPVGEELVGPRTYTVDARDSSRWHYFSFESGSLVPDPAPLEWDLAFRRFQIVVNGGDRFPGSGGAIALGAVDFDSVQVLPEQGYLETEVVRGDSIAAAFEDWYSYSLFTHLLSPGSGVYAVRSADGRYGKLRFLGYYCPGAQPGCVTFEYVFQGAGGTRVSDPT